MKRIAEQFRLDGAVQSVATLGEGFINDTYIVTTERARYVLQRKNRNVFTDIPAMMRNIEGVTSFLREKVRRAGGRTRGPAAFTSEDRARFKRNLTELLH